jgi:hypothetical protein
LLRMAGGGRGKLAPERSGWEIGRVPPPALPIPPVRCSFSHSALHA